MVAVHTLVAEVLSDFIHALKAAHDETLQVQLGGDAQVEVHVQRIVVGDEGAGTGTAGNTLQNGSFDFGIACLVQHLAHGFHHERALLEGFLDIGIDDKVHVALAIAQFGVIKAVVGHAILLLDHRQGFQALGQNGDFLGQDGDFARLGAKHRTLDTNKVAQVEQLLEYCIIVRLVVIGTEVIAAHIYLDAALGVKQFGETGLTHDTAAHHTTSHAHFARFCLFIKSLLDFS